MDLGDVVLFSPNPFNATAVFVTRERSPGYPMGNLPHDIAELIGIPVIRARQQDSPVQGKIVAMSAGNSLSNRTGIPYDVTVRFEIHNK